MRGETGASWTNESVSNKVKQGSSLFYPILSDPASIINGFAASSDKRRGKKTHFESNLGKWRRFFDFWFRISSRIEGPGRTRHR